VKSNVSSKPIRRATSASCHQSARASPGPSRNGRWREMRRSEFVTVPLFSPQPSDGRSTSAWRAVSVSFRMSETTTKGQALIAASTASASGIETTGLVAMIHSALMRPSATALNMSTALRPGLRRDRRRLPEALDAIAILGALDCHMGGEHVGEAADLAAAHGVGLAGHRKRSHARPADAAGGEVAVDDGVDLVGARRRLVDALAVDGDDLFGRGEQPVEGEAAWPLRPVSRRTSGRAPTPWQRLRRNRWYGRRHRLVEALARQVGEQAVEQGPRRYPAGSPDAGRRCRRRHGAARVDDHDLHRRTGSLGGGQQALVDDRVAPGEVGADQHDQIGQLDVLVTARHRVGAKGAACGRRRRTTCRAANWCRCWPSR
jgi:hypothetical protein